MKITDDTDLLVGEYVLGTLESDERAKLEEIAAREPMVAASVMVWERRLAPLHELIVPVAPPDTVWPEIEKELLHEDQDSRLRDPGFLEVAHALAQSYKADTAMALVQRMRRWRTLAVLFGAAAVFLAAYLGAQMLRGH
jgi:anti-sigma-K factor RskA